MISSITRFAALAAATLFTVSAAAAKNDDGPTIIVPGTGVVTVVNDQHEVFRTWQFEVSKQAGRDKARLKAATKRASLLKVLRTAGLKDGEHFRLRGLSTRERHEGDDYNRPVVGYVGWFSINFMIPFEHDRAAKLVNFLIKDSSTGNELSTGLTPKTRMKAQQDAAIQAFESAQSAADAQADASRCGLGSIRNVDMRGTRHGHVSRRRSIVKNRAAQGIGELNAATGETTSISAKVIYTFALLCAN